MAWGRDVSSDYIRKCCSHKQIIRFVVKQKESIGRNSYPLQSTSKLKGPYYSQSKGVDMVSKDHADEAISIDWNRLKGVMLEGLNKITKKTFEMSIRFDIMRAIIDIQHTFMDIFRNRSRDAPWDLWETSMGKPKFFNHSVNYAKALEHKENC